MNQDKISFVDNIDSRFSSNPDPENQDLHFEIRELHKNLALALDKIIPASSREKSLMLTNLEQSCFWANAAVARA
jgi:hypothetical protein